MTKSDHESTRSGGHDGTQSGDHDNTRRTDTDTMYGAERGEPMSTVNASALTAHEFCKGMSGPQLAKLATAARHVEYPSGHRFFEEEETADGFWLIQAGQVALDLHVPGRGVVIIETFGRGTVLGWSWLFPPYQWRFGAVAMQPVRAIAFDGKLVRTFCAADPELGYELTRRFTAIVLNRLQSTRLRLIDVYSNYDPPAYDPDALSTYAQPGEAPTLPRDGRPAHTMGQER